MLQLKDLPQANNNVSKKKKAIVNNGPRHRDFQNEKASAWKGNFPVHVGSFVLLLSKADAIFKCALLSPVFFS